MVELESIRPPHVYIEVHLAEGYDGLGSRAQDLASDGHGRNHVADRHRGRDQAQDLVEDSIQLQAFVETVGEIVHRSGAIRCGDNLALGYLQEGWAVKKGKL